MRRIRKEMLKEDGAIAVIVVLMLSILLCFTSFAIDESMWRTDQKNYQNAIDAAALQAAKDIYINNSTVDTATKDAKMIAAQENVNIDISEDDLVVTKLANNKVSVTMTKKSKNYFSQLATGKTSTDISIKSIAQAIVTTVNNGYPINSAFDAASGISITGTTEGSSSGDYYSGGKIIITNYIKTTGDFKCDGDINIVAGQNYVYNSSIYSGGNVYISSPLTLNGSIQATGNITNQSGSGTINGDCIAGGIESKIGAKVTGKEESHASVTHTPYTWRWASIENWRTENKTLTITEDVVKDYLANSGVDSNEQYYFRYYNGNLNINEGSHIKTFLSYVKNKYGKQNIYINGSLTIQGQGEDIDFPGMIIAENGIKFEDGKLKFSNNTIFVAEHGGLVTDGKYLDLTGALINMDSTANVTSNNDGTVHGAIISKGSITDTHTWNVFATSDWQKYLPSGATSSTSSTDIKLVSN